MTVAVAGAIETSQLLHLIVQQHQVKCDYLPCATPITYFWLAPSSLAMLAGAALTATTIVLLVRVETLIYRDPQLIAAMHSFCLSVVTDSFSTPRPGIALELNDGISAESTLPDRLAHQFQTGLAGLNLDYREALTEFSAAMIPVVQVYAPGQGPFRLDAGRIKQRRIIVERNEPS